MNSIDFETHFYTESLFNYLKTRQDFPKLVTAPEPNSYSLQFTEQIALFQSQTFIEVLCDIGAKRIQAMDEAGLNVQILSFSSPGVDEFAPDIAAATTFAQELNDLLFEAIQKHPTRFRGFAAIAPYEVNKAVKELERTINDLKFVGWLAHSNFGPGEYFDNQKYWPLLEAAESMAIPIYIHPTTPLAKEFGTYGFSLGGPPLGFQVDVALCLLRMIYAGVFDRFPGLKIILGHMGETLPFLVPDRIDWAYANPNISKLPGFIKTRPNIQRPPSEVIQENTYVTTSGRFSKPLLDFVIQVMGKERILLATDYPYENLKQSMDFVRQCGLEEATLQQILFKNAQNLGIQ